MQGRQSKSQSGLGRSTLYCEVQARTMREFERTFWNRFCDEPLFSLMWFRSDIIGLFSNNVVSFSRNVVLGELLFSINLVPKRGCCRFEPIMFSVPMKPTLSSPPDIIFFMVAVMGG
jgi:hypothetical protein